MKRIVFIIFTLTLSIAQANQADRDRRILLKPSDSVTPTTRDLNSYPDIYLSKDSIIADRNLDTGVIDDPFHTLNDKGMVSFSYQFSYDYEDFTKISSFEASYKHKFEESYTEMWYGVQLKRTTAKYDAVAEERVSASGNTNSVATEIREENLQSLTSIGLGLGHRFKTLSLAFDSSRIFETLMVYGNYVFHVDSTDSEKYTGFGYNADYSLLYRSSKSMTYGMKLSYNWAMVERERVDDEKLPDRTLVFGWTALGFELGYYF